MAGLDALEALAREAGSAGIAAVDATGRTRLRIRDESRVVVQSVTKLVVALAAGAALSTRGDAVARASEPVGSVITDWRDDERCTATVLELLAHQAGLVPVPPHVLEAANSPTQVALDSDYDPALRGTHHYNNASTFVVAEFVRRVSGHPIDIWVARILESIGHRPTWKRSPDGTPWAHGGLTTTATALSTIGSLTLQAAAASSPPVPPEWVSALVEHGASAYPQPAWVHSVVTPRLVTAWLEAGVNESLIGPLCDLPAGGIPIESVMAQLDDEQLSALGAAVHATGHRVAEIEAGPAIGWGHDGDGGQWLIVCPDREVAIAHTRCPANYGRAPGFFPPRAVLDAV